MSKLPVAKFLDYLERSQLVEKDQLADALRDLRVACGGELPDDALRAAEFLRQAGLITQWHIDKLFEKRYRGFWLGKYKLLRHLGTGGMSAVYLAEHSAMRRTVAVKVLPTTRVKDSSYLARFYREAQAAARLDHPNIVRAFDVDKHVDEKGDEQHFLVMEYVDGDDLQRLVKRDGPLPYVTAANYIAQAANGLKHAHEVGLIHRDVKPANILVNSRGVVKVLDMGLARFSNDEEASLTKVHDENVLGTADYLAPEQALDSHNVDGRADIYSLGCTLYFVLTGHPPFPDGTLPQRLMMHQKKEPPDIRLDRNDAPADLVKTCQKMMAKSPDERFQSAADVFEALCGWLAVHGEALGFDSSSPESSSSIELSAAVSAKTRSLGGSSGRLGRLSPPGGGSGFADGSGVIRGHEATVDELIALDDTTAGTPGGSTVKGTGAFGRSAAKEPARVAKNTAETTPRKKDDQEKKKAPKQDSIPRVTIRQGDWGRLLSAERNAPRLADEQVVNRESPNAQLSPVIWIVGGVVLLVIVVLVIVLAVSL